MEHEDYAGEKIAGFHGPRFICANKPEAAPVDNIPIVQPPLSSYVGQ
jgi:hypothetical protein